MSFYRRNLPHWLPEGKCIFLTWRLYGSLPVGYLRGLRQHGELEPADEFRLAEKLRDHPNDGPLWLREPRIAEGVVGTLLRGAFEFHDYDLHSFTVMANHVHVLISPLQTVRIITRSIKGVTARQSNAILRRSGRQFWQDESFDHWFRSEYQFLRIRNYIENSPVKAGLVKKAKEWPWSSAALANNSEAMAQG